MPTHDNLVVYTIQTYVCPYILNIYRRKSLGKNEFYYMSILGTLKKNKIPCLLKKGFYSFAELSIVIALQRQNNEISKQIFPEKEYRGLSPNFHILASVSDLYIPSISLPILLEEICRPILGLYKSLTDT